MPETAYFDHYEVLTREDGSLFELGRGAMGVTYKAFDTRLRVPVALKVINSQYLNSEIARQRFLREARSAARLRHRHVASVFHLGTEGDNWFYAMEFIDGETLESFIQRNGPISPRVALKITAQVARALNAASHHGLVHRDIKPPNLMLVQEDEELIAKVIDFGLAKTSVAGEGDDAAAVSMGGFVGTFAFASPEQLEEQELDSRSDIYSLGVTLWYMLSGKVPFVGSMMQVMSQHLSKPPPFEKFNNLPPVVEDVLRKMLEKDRANRFQTPFELRATIEGCLGQISDVPATVSTPSGEENLGDLLNDASQRAGDTRFEVGVVLAQHYRIAEVLGETTAGRTFRAIDSQTERDVCVLVLHPQFVSDAAACAALDREVEKLIAIRQPNLLHIRAFETVDEASFVVMEWISGFPLLEVLRARRELKLDEVLLLLRQAAAGVDCALAAGLTGLTFDLRQVSLKFAQPAEKAELLRTPVNEWPAFELKLNPLANALEAGSHHTWAGGQTMVGNLSSQNKVEDVRLRYVQSLGSMVYELLGGVGAPPSRGGHASPIPRRYAPVSTLSEEGNDILRRALDPARSFASAKEFCDAFTTLGGTPAHRSEPKRSGAALVAPAPKPSTASRVPPAPKPSAAPPVPPAPKPSAAPPVPPAPKPSAAPPVPPAPKPSATSPVPPAPKPSAASPVPPAPYPSAAPTAPLAPIPREQIAPPQPFAPAINRKFPIALVGSVAAIVLVSGVVAALLIHHRSSQEVVDATPAPLTQGSSTPTPVTDPLKQIIADAQAGVPSAMLRLGDTLRGNNDETAFKWYSAAAAKGYAPALTQLGIMFWTGAGISSPDRATAAKNFQDAAQRGDPAASFALGECYLAGGGVAKDEKRALELFREAARGGDLRAMNRLGDCLVHGIGGNTDFAEAFRLFTQASNGGNLEALGNLGVLYVSGQGVPANPKAGVALFEKGAQAGNSFCISLLARSLESGTGIEKNLALAQTQYLAAAKAGDKRAQSWCRQRGVPVSAK